jgi:hypothetical protein
MGDDGVANPGSSNRWVAVLAWLVAIGFVVALAAAAASRLNDLSGALADAIERDRVRTSVAHDSSSAAPAASDAHAAAAAPVFDAEGRAVTPPRWLAVPSPDYPVTDEGDMVSATVALACGVDTTGRLSDCEIIGETPPGQGFGEAALRSTALARLTPRLIDGEPVEGRVNFAIRFSPDRPHLD